MNNETQTQPTQATVDLSGITSGLLNVLDARSRDIVTRRFGLTGGRRETLESIGREYGITRERVRQIESHTRKNLSALRDKVEPVVQLLGDLFAEHGGVLAEGHIVALVQERADGNSEQVPNLVRFYLHILPDYTYVTHNTLFAPHWRQAAYVHNHVDDIVSAAQDILKEEKKPVLEADLLSRVRQHLSDGAAEVSDEYLRAALIASKKLEQTVFGEWGLTTWAEVSPRGVGDKAYAVLRRHGKPEHFRVITDLINESGFDTKTANPQTVHNELIKDKRFVLVGRGLYGLKEWGFVPGTVADVLESILRKAESPLSRDELIEEVMRQRMVKKNTILLGLQNNERFVKTPENRYTLKQK